MKHPDPARLDAIAARHAAITRAPWQHFAAEGGGARRSCRSPLRTDGPHRS